MVFAVELKENALSFKFFTKSRKSLISSEFLKAPFTNSSFIKRKSPGFYIIDLIPSYPAVYYFGVVLLFGALVFTNFKITPYLIPGLLLTSCSFFWSDYFFFLMLRIGLKKAGYIGDIKRLNVKDIIKRVV